MTSEEKDKIIYTKEDLWWAMKNRHIITYEEFQQECKEYLSDFFSVSDIISQREFLKSDSLIGFRHSPYYQCKICVNGVLHIIQYEMPGVLEPFYMWSCARVDENDLVIEHKKGITISAACDEMLKQIKKENKNENKRRD